MSKNRLFHARLEDEVIKLAQELVRIKSYSGQEKDIIQFIEQKMLTLGYDEVAIDAMGNVVGRIGNGNNVIMLDGHVDTVTVNDESEWDIPPFSGKIMGGWLHGRGSVDMKSAVAAAIFAGVQAKNLGYTKGKTLFVSCTVFEEDCDGENLKHLFKELNILPDYMIICEPSSNAITLGHKGKAQIAITTHGVSAHGAAPEKGVNAIYEMSEIIQRVEQLNKSLNSINGRKGSLVLSKISSLSASLNAVPSECEIYLDRRMVPGETASTIQTEMNQLIDGKNATWKYGKLHRKSWTGLDIEYIPFHLAWKIDRDHPLTRKCIQAYEETFNSTPNQFNSWDFSTNAVTPVSLGIPTIGFGPGNSKLAHMRNERCEVKEIEDAFRFYTQLIGRLGDS